MIKYPAVAKMAHAVAVRNAMEAVLHPKVVNIPRKKIKNPKEWTVIETNGCAVNGSYMRYEIGTVLTNPVEVRILQDAGIKIVATA